MPDVKRFMLRIPDELHAQLVAWAKDDGRSLQGLLMWIVRRALKEWRS